MSQPPPPVARGTHIPVAVGPTAPYFAEVCPDCGEEKYIIILRPAPEQSGDAPSEDVARVHVRDDATPQHGRAAAAGQ